MKRLMVALAFVAVSLPAALLAVSTLSNDSPQQPDAARSAVSPRGGPSAGHNKPLPPFVAKREKERLGAADRVARGQATPTADGLVQLKDGRLVRYRLEGTEYLTAALVDFSDLQHGNIPQPNRSIDNSTYWSADVSPQHYEDMLFAPGGASYGLPSMHDFYLEQSSGRFTWTGQVSNWVQIGATAASFGANSRKSGDGGDDANGVVYRVVDATLKALESIDQPIWLIAGGRDKGGDFSRLVPAIRQRVKRLIVIGEAAPLITNAVQGYQAVDQAGTLREAVAIAESGAAAGDVVLMSPACASFDMFADYQDRGRQFKALVQSLPV